MNILCSSLSYANVFFLFLCFSFFLFGFNRSLRVFSTIQQQRSAELSQGKLKRKAKKFNIAEEHLKLSPIVQFDSCKQFPSICLCFLLTHLPKHR